MLLSGCSADALFKGSHRFPCRSLLLSILAYLMMMGLKVAQPMHIHIDGIPVIIGLSEKPSHVYSMASCDIKQTVEESGQGIIIEG